MTMTMRRACFIVFGFVAAAAIAVPVKADVLSRIESTLAADSLGSEYEIAFFTADMLTATSSSISTYNNFVTAEATSGSSYLSDFVPGGTTWNAIGSTSTVSASNNAPNNGSIPIFSTTGALIA